jgi:hypothetical protein
VKCLLAAAIAVLGWAPSVSAQTASDLLIPAAVSSPGRITMKGFNYVSYYNGGYVNADSLSAMIGTGSNSVALAFEYGIDVQNSAVYADAAYTDSMAVIAATIVEAKGHGLSVMVRPMIDFLDPAKIGTYHVGDWRSFYNPTDPAAFFASYKTMIVNVAQVAQANGATILCIGLELDQLTGPAYLSYWTDIIASVRTVFSGKLTYSADWDASISPWQGQHGLGAGTGDITTQVSFWSQLDFLGIDAYPPISDAANPTLNDLVAGWTQVPSDPISHAVTGNQSLISYFQSVATKTGKPLLFTEIGYESASDAARQPAGSSTNIYDPALQTNLYAAFFSAWQQSGNNSLIGVYFWNWDPNTAEVGPGNGANFSPQGQPAQDVVTANFGLPPNGALTATHDFAGDGKSDILWRNSNTGVVAGWLMNGSAVTQYATIATMATHWQIVGQRDFNGDGKIDILWRDTTTGAVVLWLMNGLQITQSLNVATVPSRWVLSGVGDFNGDGKADILWRDSTTGTVSIWLMNGGAVTQAGTVGTVASAWVIVGTSPNGHILWRNSSNGAVAIWVVNGFTVTSAYTIGAPASVWNVVGIGDFDGNGSTDLLWRNSATGAVAIWFLSNGVVTSSASVGTVSNVWSIDLTGDFDGNGKSDILWTNNSNGGRAIWFMNGAQVSQLASLGNVATAWAIQSVAAE